MHEVDFPLAELGTRLRRHGIDADLEDILAAGLLAVRPQSALDWPAMETVTA